MNQKNDVDLRDEITYLRTIVDRLLDELRRMKLAEADEYQKPILIIPLPAPPPVIVEHRRDWYPPYQDVIWCSETGVTTQSPTVTDVEPNCLT